ncbi:MAG TPA: gliding motility lipoprotein GldB [Sphingobacteriaceae bacterium]
MRRLNRTQIYLFFLIVAITASCRDRNKVDVSGISVDIKVERFDQEFGQLKPHDLINGIPPLQKKYGAFYADYMQGILSAGSVADTGYFQNLRTILKNPDYLALKEAVDRKFPDLKTSEAELTQAFKHVKYYYPERKTPRLISFLSGFAVQTPIGNDYIGIGLDMFLGADSRFYPALRQSIPQYISRRFTPQNITPRVMEAYLREDLYPEQDGDRSLLAKMIYNGKILYSMDAFMPEMADTLKIGYTAAQMEWCHAYESSIWGYFLEQNLLYETDYLKIQKYLAEAPFTPGLGEGNESAPKLGVWTGWQIVREYMRRNPETTLQQLLKESDPQKILSGSKYKPK